MEEEEEAWRKLGIWTGGAVDRQEVGHHSSAILNFVDSVSADQRQKMIKRYDPGDVPIQTLNGNSSFCLRTSTTKNKIKV